MTSRSGQPSRRAERTTRVKEVKSKDPVVQEDPELLEKPEASVGDLTEGARESAAGKLGSDEVSTSRVSDEEDEDEAEVRGTQTISHETDEPTREPGKVGREVRYTSRKGKESLREEVDTSTETPEPRESSENAAIRELRLKIQLAEQEHLNLQLRARIKHDRSGSADLEIDREAKRARPVKILSGANLYKSSTYSHYRDFCHQMDTGTEGMSKKAQYSEVVRHLHYSVMDRWKTYCEEKELVEEWEPLKEFLDDLLGDRANRTHNAWVEWLRVSKKDGELDEEYLHRYNELQFQIGSEANKADKIQVMLFYCGLDEPIYRKIREQPELPTTKEDMVALAKKLRPNLSFREQKGAPPYRKKSESFQKANNKSGTKPEGKAPQGDRDRSIKCFNCDKVGHLAKDCWSAKKDKAPADAANKGSSRSSHRAYGSSKKDNTTGKAKEKPAKADTSKKEAVHKAYGSSQLDLPKKGALWVVAHLAKRELRAMVDSGSDTNFLRLDIATALKLVPLYPARGAVGINQQLVNTYSVYHEQISIRNDNGEIREHREPLTSADIEPDMVLGVTWLAWRDPVISYSQRTLTWRENMGSSAESEDSDELDL